MSMFNRKPATAAPHPSATALPAGHDDESSPRFIPEPLREPWQRLAAGATIDRAARAEIVDEIARHRLREHVAAEFPVLAEWDAYLERVEQVDPTRERPRTPDEVYAARERLAERLREQLGDYIDEHEDELRERAAHVLTLEHVAREHVREQENRAASAAAVERYRCPACGVSDFAVSEPGRWSLLTGEPATQTMRHPIVGPCCLKCAQLARLDYLLALQAEPIVGRDGEPDRLESRAMIAKQLRLTAVGER